MIPVRASPPSKVVIDGPISAATRCHGRTTIAPAGLSPCRNPQTDEPLTVANGDSSDAPTQLKIPGSPAANQRPTRYVASPITQPAAGLMMMSLVEWG